MDHQARHSKLEDPRSRERQRDRLKTTIVESNIFDPSGATLAHFNLEELSAEAISPFLLRRSRKLAEKCLRCTSNLCKQLFTSSVAHALCGDRSRRHGVSSHCTHACRNWHEQSSARSIDASHSLAQIGLVVAGTSEHAIYASTTMRAKERERCSHPPHVRLP